MSTISSYFILVFFLFSGVSVYSQAQVSSDPSNPTSIGYSKKDGKGKAESPWTYAASTSAVRGLDYYAKVYMSYSLTTIYKLKKNQSISANLEYAAPADGMVDFPEDWGFEDISISYTKSEAFDIFENGKTSLRIGLGLPTSKTSQNASLRTSVSASIPTSFRWKGNSFVVSPGLGLSLHKYEEADEAGTKENSPFYMNLSLVASRTLYKSLSGSISAGLVNYANYDFHFKQIQSLGLSLSVPIYKTASLTGGYSWRDRILSHNAAFDDDRSKYFLSLSLVL